MKIEGNNLGNIQGPVTDRVGQPNQSQGASGADQTTARTTDEVTLSEDTQLLHSASKAAAGLPDIRQDVVNAARADLNAGKIGNDPQALADAIINSWLNKE
jgi:flagellar biosynthesis anti-sigma factor FlgM